MDLQNTFHHDHGETWKSWGYHIKYGPTMRSQAASIIHENDRRGITTAAGIRAYQSIANQGN
jgi:hypothetical protein